VAEVEEALAARVAGLLSARNPGHDPAELRRTADTVMSITRGALGGREVDMAEIKVAIRGYLTAKGLR
ncbi:hypothetical protein, partial [uncultured Amnibacterium sp.]|uniref:hypothetical protein n=1 Tax=uncultured Amnibacterium sp. TaxID=1631851 RepID=UPI0035CC66C6